MGDKRYDVDGVESRLNDYLENERDIDNQIERLEYLAAKMTGVGAQVITGMPKAPSASNDRMAELLGRKEELELSIREAVSRQSLERKWIEGMILHLCSSDEKAVIRMRYLDRSSWDDVLDMLFGHKDDFLDKEESYKRRMYRIRKSALINIAKYIEESEEPKVAFSVTS